jgi:hypothetical protein
MFSAASGGLSYTGVAPAAARNAAAPAMAAPAVAAAAGAEAAGASSSRAPSASRSPLPSPGDSWKYRQTKPGQGGGREHVVQVRKTGPLIDEVSVAGQAPVENEHTAGVYLVNQGVSLFSPYLNVLGEFGSTRRIRSQDNLACPQGTNCLFEASIAGYERIKVPAGEFATRKMQYVHSWQVHRFGSGSRVVTMWYADEVKRVVKVSSRTKSGDHSYIETDYDLELTEYRLQ